MFTAFQAVLGSLQAGAGEGTKVLYHDNNGSLSFAVVVASNLSVFVALTMFVLLTFSSMTELLCDVHQEV